MAAVSPSDNFREAVDLPGVTRAGISAEVIAELLERSARRLDTALTVSPRLRRQDSFEVAGPQSVVQRFASGLTDLWRSHLNAAECVSEDFAPHIFVNLSEPVVDVWAVVVLYNPVDTDLDQRQSRTVQRFWTRFEEAGGDVAKWTDHVVFLDLIPLLDSGKQTNLNSDEQTKQKRVTNAAKQRIFAVYTAERIAHYVAQAASEKFPVILCAGKSEQKRPSVDALKKAFASDAAVELFDCVYHPVANESRAIVPMLARFLAKAKLGVVVASLKNACAVSDDRISKAIGCSGEDGANNLESFVSGCCENFEAKRTLFWKYYCQKLRQHFRVPDNAQCQPFEEVDSAALKRLWELRLDHVTDVRPVKGWATFFNLDDQRLARPCPICCLATRNHAAMVHHIVDVHAPASASEMQDDVLALAVVNAVWKKRQPPQSVVISPSSAVWRLHANLSARVVELFRAWTDGHTYIPATDNARGGSATLFSTPGTRYCLRVKRGVERQAAVDTATFPPARCLLLKELFGRLTDEHAETLKTCCALPLLGCWASVEGDPYTGETMWVELMRFVRGETLMQVIKASTVPAKVFTKVQEAVRVLHDTAKLAHGDLKPHNIMLTPNTDGDFDVTLIDFTTLSDPNTVPSMSTPGYYESESQTAIERDEYALEVIRMQLLVASLVKDKQDGVEEPKALKQFEGEQLKLIRAAYEAPEPKNPYNLETAEALPTLMDRNPLRCDESTPLSWDACVEMGLASVLPPPDAIATDFTSAQPTFNQVATQAAELMRRCSPTATDLLTLHTCYTLLNHRQCTPHLASASFASHVTASKASQMSHCSLDTIRSFFAAALARDCSGLEDAAALAEHCIRDFDQAGGDVTVARLLEWFGSMKPSERNTLKVMHVVLTSTAARTVLSSADATLSTAPLTSARPLPAAVTPSAAVIPAPVETTAGNVKRIVMYRLPQHELDDTDVKVWRFGTLMSDATSTSLQLRDVVPRPCDACFTHPEYSGWSVAYPPTVKAFPTCDRVVHRKVTEVLAETSGSEVAVDCGQEPRVRYAAQHVQHTASAVDDREAHKAFLKKLIRNGNLRSLHVDNVTDDMMLDIASALAGKSFLAKVDLVAPVTAHTAEERYQTTADVLALKLRCATLSRCCRDIRVTTQAVPSALLTRFDDSRPMPHSGAIAALSLQQEYLSHVRTIGARSAPLVIGYATCLIEQYGMKLMRESPPGVVGDPSDRVREEIATALRQAGVSRDPPPVIVTQLLDPHTSTWVVDVQFLTNESAAVIIDSLIFGGVKPSLVSQEACRW